MKNGPWRGFKVKKRDSVGDEQAKTEAAHLLKPLKQEAQNQPGSAAAHLLVKIVQAIMQRVLQDVGQLVATTEEQALRLLEKKVASVASFLDPLWISRQEPDKAEVYPLAGADLAFLLCNHELAEFETRITKRPFREVQGKFTSEIIRPLLERAGCELSPRNDVLERHIVSESRWREFADRQDPHQPTA